MRMREIEPKICSEGNCTHGYQPKRTAAPTTHIHTRTSEILLRPPCVYGISLWIVHGPVVCIQNSSPLVYRSFGVHAKTSWYWLGSSLWHEHICSIHLSCALSLSPPSLYLSSKLWFFFFVGYTSSFSFFVRTIAGDEKGGENHIFSACDSRVINNVPRVRASSKSVCVQFACASIEFWNINFYHNFSVFVWLKVVELATGIHDGRHIELLMTLCRGKVICCSTTRQTIILLTVTRNAQ